MRSEFGSKGSKRVRFVQAAEFTEQWSALLEDVGADALHSLLFNTLLTSEVRELV